MGRFVGVPNFFCVRTLVPTDPADLTPFKVSGIELSRFWVDVISYPCL
jgi:hypothetical protein